MSIVTIVSEPYCGGDEIADLVAERIGYARVDRDFCEYVAQAFDLPADRVRRALTGERSLVDTFWREDEKSVLFARAALAKILVQQYLVFHGVAARLIPPSLTHVLRVGIVGEPEFRAEAAAQAEGFDAKKAARRVEKDDAQRKEWARRHLGGVFWDPAFFDITVPRPATSVADAVALIVEATKTDALLPTDQSIQAQLDFLLASRVEVALLEQGSLLADVTAEEAKVVARLRTRRAPTGAIGRSVHAIRQESQVDRARKIAESVPGVRGVTVVPSVKLAGTLLVDDEREYVVTLSERLRMRNIESAVVYDGQSALDAVRDQEPSVIVLDLKMPGLDGMEVLRRVRRDHPDVQVIVVTAYGTEETEELARSLGAFDFLRKPVDITTLAARIAEAQRHHRDPSTQ